MRKPRLIEISTQYDKYLSSFYRKHPETLYMDYEDLYNYFVEDCFAECDFLHRYLREMGYETELIFFNNRNLQEKSPYMSKGLNKVDLMLKQIDEFAPDIIYITNLLILSKDELKCIKNNVKGNVRVVGYHFSDITRKVIDVLPEYDIVFTGNNHFRKKIEAIGGKAINLPHAFMPSINKKLVNNVKKNNICFCGSIMLDIHLNRFEILDMLIDNHIELDINGDIYGEEKVESANMVNSNIKNNSDISKKIQKLKKVFMPSLFGLEYYQNIYDHKICLNVQGDYETSMSYANMRVFEVTGVGSCLLTDYREGLKEFFLPDKEIIMYKNKDELIDRIKWLEKNENERERIACAGQKRTLEDYNYEKKAILFDKCVRELLG